MTETSKKVQEEIKESAHKIWLAGLGALAAAEEEGSKIFNTLVEKGEGYESRGKDELAKVKDKVEGAFGKAEGSWEKLGDAFDDKVAGAIKRLGVPSSDEITTLTKRVEELTLKVDQLKTGTAKSK
jgi:poly(hydroxyalkanoate) granule-associated protein